MVFEGKDRVIYPIKPNPFKIKSVKIKKYKETIQVHILVEFIAKEKAAIICNEHREQLKKRNDQMNIDPDATYKPYLYKQYSSHIIKAMGIQIVDICILLSFIANCTEIIFVVTS